MATLERSGGGRVDRALRRLCRCDGLKDLAVVAALVVIFGSLAVRLSSVSAPAGPPARSAVNFFS